MDTRKLDALINLKVNHKRMLGCMLNENFDSIVREINSYLYKDPHSCLDKSLGIKDFLDGDMDCIASGEFNYIWTPSITCRIKRGKDLILDLKTNIMNQSFVDDSLLDGLEIDRLDELTIGFSTSIDNKEDRLQFIKSENLDYIYCPNIDNGCLNVFLKKMIYELTGYNINYCKVRQNLELISKAKNQVGKIKMLLALNSGISLDQISKILERD